MNEKKLNYQRQVNLNKKINDQNKIVNINNQAKETSNNIHNFEQKDSAFNTSNIKVGRNKTQPVRVENGNYNLSQPDVDTSFTHSKINFGNEILESQGMANTSISIEKQQNSDNEIKLSNSNYDFDKNKKTKLLIMKVVIIGVIIELVIIGVIGIYKLISNNKVTNVLSCTTSINDDINQAIIETENVYYFNRLGNFKRKLITKYTFNDKTAFDKYKKNYVDTGIYDVSGLTYENSFNSSQLSYTYTINYDLKKMKKDQKNKSEIDNRITIVDSSGNTLIDLEILDFEALQANNIDQGYTCIQK